MQPQAQMLENSGLMPLLDELAAAALTAAGRDGEAREQMSLEVASTLLFMQNAVDQEDLLHADFAVRAEGQQARLNALIEGREMPASVMASASQHEAERDMLMHMAQEVGQNLKQMEEALDAFFRDAGEREALTSLPVLAQQAQGALTMLELPDAANLLRRHGHRQPFAAKANLTRRRSNVWLMPSPPRTVYRILLLRTCRAPESCVLSWSSLRDRCRSGMKARSTTRLNRVALRKAGCGQAIWTGAISPVTTQKKNP